MSDAEAAGDVAADRALGDELTDMQIALARLGALPLLAAYRSLGRLAYARGRHEGALDLAAKLGLRNPPLDDSTSEARPLPAIPRFAPQNESPA
jgi:hypothetical protein